MIGAVSAVALAAISAGPTRGQTNIDQGKPASELFANYCAVCHKSTRGLANGRSSLTLSLFLREHYAASGQQAAALAAYVISAGGNAPAAKPEQRARPEEPKGQESKGQEAKGQETKGHEGKPRAASVSPKPEPERPARPSEPGHVEPSHAVEPGREEAPPAQQQPATAVAAPGTGPDTGPGTGPGTAPATARGTSAPPSAAELPELGPTPSAGASAESQPNDSAPVPRDNIPD
jgi:hypothetical protein